MSNAERRILTRGAKPPARMLAEVVKLCNPYFPIESDEDAPLRVNLDALRGGNRLDTVARHIRRSRGEATLQLFTGHIGCGKTTELRQMARELERDKDGSPGLHVVFVDAENELNLAEAGLGDILLAVAKELANQSWAAGAKALTKWWESRIESALRDLLVDPTDTAAKGLAAWAHALRFSGGTTGPKTRGLLNESIPSLIDALNKALSKIREATDSPEVAIIIDNLEKLHPIDPAAIEKLYLQDMPTLRGLDAHLVITVPIQLCLQSAGASITAVYGSRVIVLPMIKVCKHPKDGGGPFPDGIQAMRSILEKRVDLKAVFLDPEKGPNYLIVRSGGCTRHLLRLVESAANELDAPPITQAEIERACWGIRNEFEHALAESWIPHLLKIDSAGEFPVDMPAATKAEMLRHLFVLEYQNGPGGTWYCVHPLVKEIRRYKDAEAARGPQAAPQG